MSLSSHQSRRMRSSTHITPLGILQRLAPFDLDPCCPPRMPWKTASTMYSRPLNDGLRDPWFGRVWLNPPFGGQARTWLEKMAEHGNGVALIPARTETKTFMDFVWRKADGALFLHGRFRYRSCMGVPRKFNCGAPMVLVAYGLLNVRALEASRLGTVVTWNKSNVETLEWER